MPDHAPKDALKLIQNRSNILPVPIEDKYYKRSKSHNKLVILWNHRWEYDKAPERFFAALYELKNQKVDFTLHVVGQQFRKTPSIFKDAKEYLSDHICTWGYQDTKEAYQNCLEQSTVIVSTAMHEFQGLALLEAVAAGCYPLAPNRLAYPQFLPEECLYPSFPNDKQRERNELVKKLLVLYKKSSFIAPKIESLRWSNLASEYRRYIAEVRTTNLQ